MQRRIFAILPSAFRKTAPSDSKLNLPSLIGGSAYLDPSTFTALSGLGDFEAPGASARDRQGSEGGGWSRAGRNLHFGVREHGMAWHGMAWVRS